MTTAEYHPFRSAQAKAEYLAVYDQAVAEWPIPFEEQMVDTSYGQTFVRISGPADAPPLILLPGAGGCSLQWRLNIEALSKSHRTYAVDGLINLGCVGRSVYTRPISDAPAAMVWLDELFDGLGLTDNIRLLGVSHSGWLASQYALHAPNRLSGLVLVAPAGTILPFRAPYILGSILINVIPHRNVYLRFFKWSFKDLARKDGRFIEALTDDFMLSARCFEPMNPKELPRLTAMSDEELLRITTPTLVLLGENEVLYSAQAGLDRLKTAAPHIKAKMIPQAGHDLLLVQADLVHQKIETFLAQI